MDKIIEGFRALSAASISDAMDRLGLHGMAQGIAPLKFGWHAVGRAFTVKYRPVGSTKGTVGDFIDDVNPGDMVVLDNGGRLDCTVWGDILTNVASRRKISGTVIHGVCRDVAGILECNYPVFSRGRFMRTGKDRVEVDGFNVPVSLGDVLCKPQDIVVGTDDGVLVVPADRAEAILKLAQTISDTEDRIIAETKSGSSLDEAHKKHGYHQLQTKR